jgi:hypothetical protein
MKKKEKIQTFVNKMYHFYNNIFSRSISFTAETVPVPVLEIFYFNFL